MLSDADLDDLERKADAATPGPWECRVTPIIECSTLRWAQGDMADPGRHEADAAFIAAANPATVKALIAEIRRLRKG